MDVIMFVAVNMRVLVLMVGLVGVGGFVLAAVTEKYFSGDSLLSCLSYLSTYLWSCWCLC